MIIVIVTYENGMDRRQTIKGYPWRTAPVKPMPPIGDNLTLKTGSVKIFIPSTWIKNVA